LQRGVAHLAELAERGGGQGRWGHSEMLDEALLEPELGGGRRGGGGSVALVPWSTVRSATAPSVASSRPLPAGGRDWP
jgi:hypothetical protein